MTLFFHAFITKCLSGNDSVNPIRLDVVVLLRNVTDPLAVLPAVRLFPPISAAPGRHSMSHSAVTATPCGKSPSDGGLNAGYLQSLPGLLKVGQTVSFCGTGDVTAER